MLHIELFQSVVHGRKAGAPAAQGGTISQKARKDTEPWRPRESNTAGYK